MIWEALNERQTQSERAKISNSALTYALTLIIEIEGLRLSGR